MRRALLLALAVLAACGPRPTPAPNRALERVRADAASAQKELAAPQSAPAPRPQPAPAPQTASAPAELQPADEELPTSKVLQKDPEGCTWVESEATVNAGEQDSKHQAKAAAVAEARKTGMQAFLGVDVRSRFMDFQQEGLRDEARLTENILQTTRLGRILKERVIEDHYKSVPGCRDCRYYVKLQTCLLQAAGEDKDFHVDLAISRTRFVAGDEARLSITANRDCYVYVYDVWGDWNTALVVPNEAFEEVPLKAGRAWEYPDEPTRRRGVRLTAEMQDELAKVSAETIRVIASKTPIPKRVRDPKDGGYLGVLRRMNASRLDWAEDAQAYTIYRH